MMTRRLAGAMMVLAMASCGGSNASGGSSTDVDRFLGTWTVANGMLMASCAGLNVPISAPLMGEQTVEKGTDSDLAFNVQPKCRLLLDVSGDTATVRPGQACTVSAAGAEVPGTVNSGNLKVMGEMATFEFAGEATLALGKCTFMANGSSARTAGP
jgi:hypothetical protein